MEFNVQRGRRRLGVRPDEQAHAHVAGRHDARGPLARERRARARSPQLVNAVTTLDTHVGDGATAEVMEWIKKEYDAREGGILIGLFSTCYLGYPFVDHRMDVFGGIAEHYAAGDDVPSPFERARPLAMSGAYAYIEIYSDGEVIPVRDDGSTGGSAWI